MQRFGAILASMLILHPAYRRQVSQDDRLPIICNLLRASSMAMTIVSLWSVGVRVALTPTPRFLNPKIVGVRFTEYAIHTLSRLAVFPDERGAGQTKVGPRRMLRSGLSPVLPAAGDLRRPLGEHETGNEEGVSRLQSHLSFFHLGPIPATSKIRGRYLRNRLKRPMSSTRSSLQEE
ncbi:hypothetical protein QBC47DRAFT_145817 [Echria macrotheca]|uniref:Uncharacterized protein n=1 Tax=Echria macrotheca TaxID=438768 RepID=A0AAJ0FEC2_9PEZI|nr:hypothetical protein QBC47DRAFT_145817 [Echria macrotheca]